MIEECKIFLVIITSNYYSNALANLFTKRAVHYSKLKRKQLVVMMDYEPSLVSHSRYMRPIELEKAELVVYNEENIQKSCEEFDKIVKSCLKNVY